MNFSQLIDHTNLKQDTKRSDIISLCEEFSIPIDNDFIDKSKIPLKVIKSNSNEFLTHKVEPSEPKKNLLKLLSIPITSKPFLQKKFTDSDPTKPDDPVINTTDIT